jgi:predicted XRE-type DNA-binding protein
MPDTKITRSGGNVFADIGLPNSGELSIKSELVMNLRRLMDLHGLTQKEVAARVGSDQPTISKVIRGRLDLVTTDRLLNWFQLLGQEICISIRDNFTRESPKERTAGCGGGSSPAYA